MVLRSFWRSKPRYEMVKGLGRAWTFSCSFLYNIVATWAKTRRFGFPRSDLRHCAIKYSYHAVSFALVKSRCSEGQGPILRGASYFLALVPGLLPTVPINTTSSGYLLAPRHSIHSCRIRETHGTQHITKHGSSWTCSMPFNIYPSLLSRIPSYENNVQCDGILRALEHHCWYRT